QDTDNLVWKLKLVMDGQAPQRLLDTYSDERAFAADENILNSTRSTDFITPKSSVSKVFRNAVLELAEQHAFARKLVNSGRLSVPAFYTESALNTPDADSFAGDMVPGAPMEDGPIADGKWLIDKLGNRFQLLIFADDPADLDPRSAARFGELAHMPIPVETLVIASRSGTVANARTLVDVDGVITS